MSRIWLRWLPAIAVPAVIAAGALLVPLQAEAAVHLPTKTPAQLLALAEGSSVQALSGTISQTSDLGLPQLPTDSTDPGAASVGATTSGVASMLNLLTGDHSARVYLDGPKKMRVQVLDTMAERDVVRNGGDVWLYDSQHNSATHLTLPAGATRKNDALSGALSTPPQLAQRLLAAIDPSTKVTVGQNLRVASRTAYVLVLHPRQADTLVGSVSIAVDSQTGLPLSVDVWARGQKSPAFRLGFTTLSLKTPDAARFSFAPPPGATVKQQKLPGYESPGTRHGTNAQRPSTSGSGWGTVIEVPAGAVPTDVTSSSLLAEATKAVAGGRLLHTSLLDILFANDGRVLVGSVPLAALQSAAAAR